MRSTALLLLAAVLIPMPAVAQATDEAVADEAVIDPPPEPRVTEPAPERAVAIDPPMRHAPRAYSLTAGYAFSPLNDLPLSATDGTFRPMGVAVEGRYGWQVGGLDGGRPSWVGISTSYFAHTRGSPRSSSGIDYGLFVRHALFPGPRVRGFFGYGLGACQVFVHGIDGRGIGHMTALSLGIDIELSEKRYATLELSYRFVIVPSLATPLEPAQRYDFHALRLVAGFFFGG